jgi:hypothetical protein
VDETGRFAFANKAFVFFVRNSHRFNISESKNKQNYKPNLIKNKLM